jgi:hypothetical protein
MMLMGLRWLKENKDRLDVPHNTIEALIQERSAGKH